MPSCDKLHHFSVQGSVDHGKDLDKYSASEDLRFEACDSLTTPARRLFEGATWLVLVGCLLPQPQNVAGMQASCKNDSNGKQNEDTPEIEKSERGRPLLPRCCRPWLEISSSRHKSKGDLFSLDNRRVADYTLVSFALKPR